MERLEIQTRLVQNIRYYEEAALKTKKILMAAPMSSEAQGQLFNSVRYYQNKVKSLRKELEEL